MPQTNKSAEELLREAEIRAIKNSHDDTIQNNLYEDRDDNLFKWLRLENLQAMQTHADNTAAEFAEWVGDSSYIMVDGFWEDTANVETPKTTTQLLTIFKSLR